MVVEVIPKRFSACCSALQFDPTKVLIVTAYVGLWVVHIMLVHASAHPRYKNDFAPGTLNSAFVILLTEFVKLIVSASILVVQKGLPSYSSCTFWNSFRLGPVVQLAAEVFPIACFYAVGNNLMINNLQYFDPTVYLILSSSRLIMTAIVMQIFMRKTISRMRKLSILIIFAGLCMKKTSSESNHKDHDDNTHSDLMTYMSHLGLIMIQLLSGVLASVWNEMLLKRRKSMAAAMSAQQRSSTTPKPPSSEGGPDQPPITNINACNLCLYVESILINGLVLLVITPMEDSSFSTNFDMVCSSVLHQGIILSLALVGIVSSFFICHIDSLSKAVASTITVLFTSSLGRIFFGYEITSSVIWSVLFVSVGVHSYTFSNEKDANLTLASAGHALSKSVRQLWFIPILLYLITMLDTIWILNQVFDSIRLVDQGIFDSPQIGLPKGFAMENVQNEQWLDEHLHQLGSTRGFLSPDGWQRYVRQQLSNPLIKTLLETKGCRVLDVGCGGGAFARSLLQLHNGVEVLGVDHSETMIEISRASLNKFSNYTALIASMKNASSMQEAIGSRGTKEFHIALLMDSLCHLPDSKAVEKAIANALYPLHHGGLLVASMLPQTTFEEHQFCQTTITNEQITRMGVNVGYEVLHLDIVGNASKVEHQEGLYSFLLKKTKKTGWIKVEDMASNQGVNSSQISLHSTEWPIPEGAEEDIQKIHDYRQAQNLLHYIVAKLEEKNVPVMLKWGTVLHEFRSGVENDFVPEFYDKDIDIGVFPKHFGLIEEVARDTSKLFGWQMFPFF